MKNKLECMVCINDAECFVPGVTMAEDDPTPHALCAECNTCRERN